ncbi:MULTISPECIES: hypothetical protein [unclassified Streptomyces]|uniref:hypothetical protein n=1 Tax=unclassified Streptomyces TaxID=2593676 RepID=UPI002DD7D2DA|nr:hypothetical protein [Streptomyces sp. NBC_01445]WSE11314.1 hypothetical protein OG574_49610 [Streptomyces sp. NBC_01445]
MPRDENFNEWALFRSSAAAEWSAAPCGPPRAERFRGRPVDRLLQDAEVLVGPVRRADPQDEARQASVG